MIFFSDPEWRSVHSSYCNLQYVLNTAHQESAFIRNSMNHSATACTIDKARWVSTQYLPNLQCSRQLPPEALAKRPKHVPKPWHGKGYSTVNSVVSCQDSMQRKKNIQYPVSRVITLGNLRHLQGREGHTPRPPPPPQGISVFPRFQVYDTVLWTILFSSVSGRDPVMFCSSVSVWSPTVLVARCILLRQGAKYSAQHWTNACKKVYIYIYIQYMYCTYIFSWRFWILGNFMFDSYLRHLWPTGR